MLFVTSALRSRIDDGNDYLFVQNPARTERLSRYVIFKLLQPKSGHCYWLVFASNPAVHVEPQNLKVKE